MAGSNGGRRYATVDVFTRETFGGNPLAVVLDADGLDDRTMQQVAAEFAYSETTFVLPPEDEEHSARVRIFTPKAELPFAGHPNIGTAYVLAAGGEVFGVPVGDRLVFEEGAGLVPVDLIYEDDVLVGARLTTPRLPERGADIPAEVVAACARLPAEVIIGRRHPPCVASCGIAFAIAELAGRDVLDVAAADAAAFAALSKYGTSELLLYVAGGAGDDTDFTMRMFAPLLGVPEDPATGSAAAALAGLRAMVAAEDDLELAISIAQGAAVGRPSLLFADADKQAGRVTAVRVAGACVPVMAGRLLDI